MAANGLATNLSSLGKLARAKEHLDALQGSVEAFLQPDCYQIINDFQEKRRTEDAVSGRLSRRVEFKSDPPITAWANVTGDIVHNLRSALDHVIYAISFSRDPDAFRNDHSTQFPICDEPNDFNRASKRKPAHYEIRGLRPEAFAIVEGLQPYNGQVLVEEPLRILREMSNLDKHRNIHITTWSAHTIRLDNVRPIAEGVEIHSVSIRPPGEIKSGAELAAIELTWPGDAGDKVYMERNFTFTVAFADDMPMPGQQLQVGLYNLFLYVEGVIQALAPFVKK